MFNLNSVTVDEMHTASFVTIDGEKVLNNVQVSHHPAEA